MRSNKFVSTVRKTDIANVLQWKLASFLESVAVNIEHAEFIVEPNEENMPGRMQCYCKVASLGSARRVQVHS